jgi:hypothetical protein
MTDWLSFFCCCFFLRTFPPPHHPPGASPQQYLAGARFKPSEGSSSSSSSSGGWMSSFLDVWLFFPRAPLLQVGCLKTVVYRGCVDKQSKGNESNGYHRRSWVGVGG